MTTMTPVTEILRNATRSGDFGSIDDYDSDVEFWERMIRTKAADSGFGHLVESYLEHGWLPGSTIGWDGRGIMNGHHRLVMAILLGIDEVPTTPHWGQEIDAPESHPASASTHRCEVDPYPILLDTEARSYNDSYMEEMYGSDYYEDSDPCDCGAC